ncbi:MAG: hypothetical protein BWK78_03055 [Thiotrichaceae bacterium IS1]|nr:MAG: hypothetical protein BWK78_03055 [Thiotrichaceae bacterium IS1]
MPTIKNYTPHPITFISQENISYDEKTRKYFLKNQDAKPKMEIPPSGVLLSVELHTVTAGTIDGIPVITRKLISIPAIPDDVDYCIVSQLFASACRITGLDTSKLLCIGEPVYALATTPQVVGVLNLQMA